MVSRTIHFVFSFLLSGLTLCFCEDDLKTILTEELSEKQDYLSGDVQELVELQTQEKVIQKLEEVETNMVEATLNLIDGDTSGETIAIQTEIIEKAYEAAKAKQDSKNSKSGTDKALMEMLRKMLGKEEEAQPSKSKGSSSGKAGGKGQEGEANSGNEASSTASSTLPIGSTRSVPSAAPTAGQLLPAEFQELVDDYNKN